MPSYEYKGFKFNSDHELSAEEWKDTLAYFDAQPPKESKSLLDKFKHESEGFGLGAKHAVNQFNQMLAVGTLGLPSLGVDKAVQAITGDEDYINPVSKYVTGLVDETQQAAKASEENIKTSDMYGAGNVVGTIAGKVPEIVAGGMGSMGMKTIQPVAGQLLPSIQQMAQQGYAAAQPLAVNAGLGKYGEALETGHDTLDAASAGLGAYGNMAIQGTLPMGLSGTMGKRFASGMAANIPAGIAGRQLENVTSPTDMQQPLYDPKAMVTDALMGGVLHTALGRNNSDTPNINKPKPSEESGSIEQDLIKASRERSVLEKDHALELINELTKDGDVTPYVIKVVDSLKQEIEHHDKAIARADTILSGKNPNAADETHVIDMQRMYDKMDNAAGERNPTRRTRASLDEEIPLDVYSNEPPLRAHEIDMETGEILSRSEPFVKEEPTKSPHEIAVTKLQEARNEPIEAVAERITKAQEALDTITGREGREDTPGSDYSALKEALGYEIQGYESIIRGEEPKAALEPIPTREGTWVDEPTTEQKAIAEKVEEAKAGMNSVDGRDLELDRLKDERRQWKEWGQNREMASGLSPKQAKATAKYNLGKLERLEKNILNKIEQDAEGLLPSGSVDHGKLERSLESIKEQRGNWENIIEWAEERIIKTGTKEEKFAIIEEKTRPADPKFNSMQELTATTGEDAAAAVRAIENNSHLVKNPSGTKIFYDKNINPKVQNILSHLLEITNFGKEKIIFVNTEKLPIKGGDRDAAARVQHVGNTTYIRLRPLSIEGNLARLQKLEGFNKLTGGKVTEALEHVHTVRYAAHELGHAMLNKYLRDSVTHVNDLLAIADGWNTFNKTNKHQAISIFDLGNEDARTKNQQVFHEYFAEKVAKELIHKHIFDAFDKRSGRLLSEIHDIINASYQYLKTKYNFTENKKTYADGILHDILNDSKAFIAETSKQAYERVKILENDKILDRDRLIMKEKESDYEAFPFYKKTLQEVRSTLDALDGITHQVAAIGDNIKDPYHTPISVRSIINMGSGMVGRNLFGKLSLAKVLRENPVINEINYHIRNAEHEANKISNRLWFGDVIRDAWDKANPIARMKKIKAESSAYMQLKFASHEDAAVIHDLFKLGFENTLTYADNLAKNGTHLTIKQEKLYKVLSNLFASQYNETLRIERDVLNKKRLMENREGWYPAVRNGRFYVDISFSGNTVHRQHFRSIPEAKLFKDRLLFSGVKHLDISEPMKLGEDVQFSSMFRTIDLVNDIIKQHYPNAAPHIQDRVNDALQNIIQRGGTLGKHHEHRSNLSGYMGSELLMSKKELGESFKKAIQHSVEEYSGGLRNMLIKHHTDPILEKLDSTQGMDENTILSAKQMVDSALNRVENKFEKADDSVRNLWDSALRLFTGEIKANGKYSFDNFSNNALQLFYVLKLMPKLAFAVAQLFSLSAAVREMSYDGGFIRPYISGGKALVKILSGNDELKDTLFKVSQETNTFEPKFVEALHLGEYENKVWLGLRDYVLLGKLNEAADSFTRLMTFSSNYEMYKDLGFSKAESERRAMENTDSTMAVYGRTEAAPIFNKTGILGNAAKPLQTYGATQLANFVSDIRHMKTKDPQTWAPFVNYLLVTTLLSGVSSLILVQEYEMLRSWLNENYPKYFKLPSVLDIMASDPSFLDRVIVTEEDTKEALKITATYGIPALSGLDMASSARANETFPAVIAAVLLGKKAWYEMTPMLQALGTTVAGTATIAGSFVGDTTDADKRKALTNALPVGHLGYAGKELAGVNTTKVAGKSYTDPKTGLPMVAGGTGNEAIVSRGPLENLAGYLGTKSTHERRVIDATRLANEEEKINRNRQKALIENFHETGDRKYLTALVKTGMTESELESGVASGAWKRIAPADLRYFVSAKGTIPETPEGLRKTQRIFNFGLGKAN